MNAKFFGLLLSFSFLVVKAQNNTKVLFIGNSITYYNNMPQTFEAIANSLGDPTEITMYAPGGTGILDHVNDPNVYDLFRQGGWNYVVLQPGSQESPGYSEPKEETLVRLQKLQDSIYHYNACAKILLYEIPYGVMGNSQADVDNYNNTMNLILSNCQYWADEAEIFFAPAGEAVRTAWNNDTSTMLWISTGNVHPNSKGSYIIACAMYASIFQKPSFGTDVIDDLTPQEAGDYQQLADDIVLNNFPDWRINSFYQFTDFEFSINQSVVSFTNLSQNIDSLLWDFGDGSTSTDLQPTHNYAQTGNFEVSLTTYKDGCEQSQTKSLEITSLGMSNMDVSKNYQVYPNPFDNYIYINNYSGNEISIYNLLGQKFNLPLQRTDTGMLINTSELPSAWYIVKTPEFYLKMYKL